jgi:hypothetical protein
MPPNNSTHTRIGQYTAPTPAVAAGDSRPMNHVSVALSTACTALFNMKGNASAATATGSIRRRPPALSACPGSSSIAVSIPRRMRQ